MIFHLIKFSRPVGVGASLATSIACILLVIQMVTDRNSILKNTAVVQGPLEFKDFSLALGTIVFSLAGHPAFPTFQADMKKQLDFKWAVSLGFSSMLISHYFS